MAKLEIHVRGPTLVLLLSLVEGWRTVMISNMLASTVGVVGCILGVVLGCLGGLVSGQTMWGAKRLNWQMGRLREPTKST